MNTLKQHEFVALIREHDGIVRKVCSKYCPNEMDPDDLVQEILTQAWEAWPRFRGESKFTTWLYRVAMYTSIDQLRKYLSPRVFLRDPIGFQMAQIKDESYDEYEVIRLREERAREMLGVLSDKERDLIFLYMDGKSYKEMEQITGENQGRLRVRILRLKQRLKEAFPDYR
jgi:RNA polymerase sigma-70 factor, ECF subfamily